MLPAGFRRGPRGEASRPARAQLFWWEAPCPPRWRARREGLA